MEINYDICNVLDDKMMEYSAYVILHRALPSLEDGFKVSLRRILYTMHKENMTKLTKSANVSGQVMKIHPHSDCYPTIVNMVQADNHVNPFIIGKGAFAYHTSRDTQAASSRYSEVRIAPYSQEMMEGLKRDNVEMIPTFDGESKEPLYLPVKHPNILTHSQQGLAVGMASNFPSFNLTEVCDYTIKTINNEEVEDLIPDFSTGGKIVYNEQQIGKINTTGLGSVDIQAVYIIDGDYILIKEIPYTTTREAIIEKVIELVKNGKIKEILDIKDTTDINGMEIEIKIKKNTNPDLLMNRLYKMTPLQSSFSANMNCLVDSHPKVLGVKSIVQEWLKFRKQCIRRGLQYDINSLQEKQNRLNGLSIILSDLDKAIAIIRGSKSEKDAVEQLKSHFSLNQAQADYICTIKLVNMNNEWLTSRTKELTSINQQLKVNQENISDDSYYNQTIIEQLNHVKKVYGKQRKTTILYDVETTQTQEIITDESCAITLTKECYVKRCARLSSNHKTKDGDSILINQSCTTKHTLLIFTSSGTCYKLFAHELEATQPSNLGSYIYSLLDIPRDETIISAHVVRGYKGYLINVYENNKLAKISLDSFQTQNKRSSLKNAICVDSPLINQFVIEQDVDIIVRSNIDKVIICSTSDFNSKTTKNSAGDSLIKSKNDSVVAECYLMSEIDTDYLAVPYYKGKRGATGVYLKKSDQIKLK